MTLSLVEAHRLRAHFELTPAETALLLCVLNAEGVAPREEVRLAASLFKPLGTFTSFKVIMSKLNKKLPATVRVVPCYPEQRGRKGSRHGGTHPAFGYSISNDWAREHLMRIARAELEQARAA